jgi:flavin reductase (DIM6/NTAB) family NADH-FMN oxidoreductase RutF
MERITVNQISKFEDRKKVKFINCLTGFKSCNLIGTIDPSKTTNLSIISSAFHLGANPALIGFVIRPESVRRDTLENIRNTKVCTLNHINEDLLIRAHQTSARYEKEVSEFEECNIETEFLNEFQAPFVKESNVKMALTVINEIKITENNTNLIIANINDVYLKEGIVSDDGFIDLIKANTIAVSGLDSYHTTKQIGRLSYAKPGTTPEWLKKTGNNFE